MCMISDYQLIRWLYLHSALKYYYMVINWLIGCQFCQFFIYWDLIHSASIWCDCELFFCNDIKKLIPSFFCRCVWRKLSILNFKCKYWSHIHVKNYTCWKKNVCATDFFKFCCWMLYRNLHTSPQR